MKISKVALSFLLIFSFYITQAKGFDINPEPSAKISNAAEPIEVELKPFNPIMEYHQDLYIQYENPEVLRQAAKENSLGYKVKSIVTYPFRLIYLISSATYAKITLLISGLA